MKSVYSISVGLVLMALVSSTVQAGPREQAKRIHDRLAGVPAAPAVLDAMAAQIGANNAVAAANLAMENTAFYDVKLKNWITPWTNRDQTAFAPLNDYTATVIGMIRDNRDFRGILSADSLYISNAAGTPAYAINNNAHYEHLENNHISLKDTLIEVAQSSRTGVPASATAGVLTTRAAAKAFFIDGTNRAQFRYTMLNHLCHDMETVKDTTRTPDRIRQDISRSPGGDSRIYLNSCIGCHSGMDPLAQAFAYYNFEHDVDADPDGVNGQLKYNMAGEIDAFTGSRVVKKYQINANNFKYGFVTPDDSWQNYWRQGPNQLLGWDASLSGQGSGAKTMGEELAHSEAFARCQVEKVFQNVCLRKAVDSADRQSIDTMIGTFKSSNYQLKRVFADSAVYCKGP